MSCVMLTGAGTFMAEELLDDESINELAGKIGQEKLCNAGVAGLELDFSKGVDGCKIVDCAYVPSLSLSLSLSLSWLQDCRLRVRDTISLQSLPFSVPLFAV